MKKILVIGSFLSKTHGSEGFFEKFYHKIQQPEVELVLISNQENKILRILEIIYAVLFYKYDKIIITVFSGNAFIITEIAAYIAYIRKIKPIFSLHGGRLQEFLLKNPKRYKRVFQYYNKIVTPSNFIKDFFESNGYKVEYFPNPIDINKFPYNRSQIKTHSLLWVRAFTEIYNPHLPVKILYELKKKYKDVNLTMIGPDNGLLPDIQKLIEELELFDSITITGFIKNDELYQFYQTHQVYLNTTSYESFGIAIVEAALCGIPIVSTNVGEIPYIWTHEENILLADDFESHSFAEHCISIFESNDFATKLSLNARKNAESFDWENLKQKWTKIISD